MYIDELETELQRLRKEVARLEEENIVLRSLLQKEKKIDGWSIRKHGRYVRATKRVNGRNYFCSIGKDILEDEEEIRKRLKQFEKDHRI